MQRGNRIASAAAQEMCRGWQTGIADHGNTQSPFSSLVCHVHRRINDLCRLDFIMACTLFRIEALRRSGSAVAMANAQIIRISIMVFMANHCKCFCSATCRTESMHRRHSRSVSLKETGRLGGNTRAKKQKYGKSAMHTSFNHIMHGFLSACARARVIFLIFIDSNYF